MNELKDREHSEKKEQEKRIIQVFLREDKAVVEDPDGISEFFDTSYIGTKEKEGDKDKLILDPIEALLLHERHRIFIIKDESIESTDEKNLLSFEELLIYFSKWHKNLWQRYVVYNDLRKRGYFVRAGYGEGFEFRVYKRGADFENEAAKYLIYPIFEGTPINLNELDKITRTSISSRKDLVVAAVDRLSKPIYYSVKKFSPEEINK
jgi:tRNA-intron endonuclease